MSPWPSTFRTWRQRLASPEVVAYLGVPRWPRTSGSAWEKAQLPTDRPRAEFNLDLFPKDEFLTPDPARGGGQ